MLSTVLGLAFLSLMAAAVLPVPRVRQLLLTAGARLGQAMLLAFLGACGTFFVQPQTAPEWLTLAASPLLEESLGLSLDGASGLPWLVLAVVVVGVHLPILIIIELAITLSRQAALVQSLRTEIQQAASWVDSRLERLGFSGPAYPTMPSETAAATEALRSASQSANQAPERPAPLVLDLLQ